MGRRRQEREKRKEQKNGDNRDDDFEAVLRYIGAMGMAGRPRECNKASGSALKLPAADCREL